MQLERKVLENRFVRLEPMVEAHREDLRAACDADRVTWTGRIRDTVVFSVLAEEWPPVRDRLDARLAAFA